jgi:hypothetical protein
VLRQQSHPITTTSLQSTHWTRGWVGPRAGLHIEVRGKILSPLPEIEPRSPGRPARSQAIYWLRNPADSLANTNFHDPWTLRQFSCLSEKPRVVNSDSLHLFNVLDTEHELRQTCQLRN